MDGMLLVNKPSGITSYGVVDRIKNLLRVKKVGHSGTLDPLATGLLIVCLGRATKRVKYLMFEDKEYVGEMILGLVTNTHDIEGKVIQRNEVEPFPPEKIKDAFRHFEGNLDQIPPMFSALKYKGQKLYELARQGKEVERKPRPIKIFKLEILEYNFPKVKFEVFCSAGTYVRTLCHDIGQYLGCGACQAALTRTRIGKFLLDQSLTLEEIEDLWKKNKLEEKIIPLKGK